MHIDLNFVKGSILKKNDLDLIYEERYEVIYKIIVIIMELIDIKYI
jgi:hypothetical protein